MPPYDRPCGLAPPEASYPDIATGFAAIQAHAKANGYALMKRDSYPPKQPPTRIVYACDRSRKLSIKDSLPVHESRRRDGSGSKKCGCRMKIALKLDEQSGQWHVQGLVDIHNHEASTDPSRHIAHRIASLDPKIHAQIESAILSGLSTAQILTTIRREHPGVILAQKDVSNIIQKSRLAQLGGKTPMQWFLHELYEKGFSPAYTVNATSNFTRFLFIHPTSLELYKQNPDILLIDCIYKTN